MEAAEKIRNAIYHEFIVTGEQDFDDITMIRGTCIFLGNVIKRKINEYQEDGRFDLMSELIICAVKTIVEMSGGKCDCDLHLDIDVSHKNEMK